NQSTNQPINQSTNQPINQSTNQHIFMQHIGYTKKAKGLDGSIKVKIFDEHLEDFAQAEVLFLEISGKHLPYFIEKVEVQSDLVVQFEDVADRNTAAMLTGKSIFMRESDLLAEEDKQLELEELEYAFLTGFLMKDETVGEVGKIEEVVELPQQEMAVVSYQNKEIMIPLNEQLITEIKEKEQFLIVDLPAGLLEL
ncbi:MAG: ribosome maturation factor RimM, partial [Saprospiraceae bacterium]